MKKTNEPLALSGRVFVDKLLAYEHPHLKLRESVSIGDIKLLCVAKRPSGSYAGFFTAYIFDGKGWRKLALREGAAARSTYNSVAERLRLLPELVKELRALKGRESTWGDRAYWVKALPVPQDTKAKPVAAIHGDSRKAAAGKPGDQLLLFR
jgi:hypothetical protein